MSQTKAQIARTKRRLTAGVCVDCGSTPIAVNRSCYCDACAEKRRLRNAKRRKDRAASNKCIMCNVRKPTSSTMKCKVCRKNDNDKAAQFRRQFSLNGICSGCCNRQKQENRSQCSVCAKRRLEQSKVRRDKDRALVLSHYGGICVKCGESHLKFLTIDHINDDGSVHRRKINAKSITMWLLRNGLPVGFQILCWNCNVLKYAAKKLSLTGKGRAAIMRRWRHGIKIRAICGYGGRCSCCGEDHIDILTIDHVNGGGAVERRKINRSSCLLYSRLVREGFPAGYRVLCYNCNSGRHVNGGICPHMQVNR